MSDVYTMSNYIADLNDIVAELREHAAELKKSLAAERKQRKECEAVLREVARAPNRIAENSRIIADYFGEGN